MLRLHYHGSTTIPIEAENLRPDVLAGKSAAEIERLPVQHGNRQEPLAEFFAVSGDGGDEHVLLEGDCGRVKWIGAGMTRGRITIQGPAGMHLGAEMEGGRIDLFGSAGDWVGAEMRNGLIHVHGDAGHLVGGAYRGSRHGMRGGVILVDGEAQNEVGGTMRRGLIAIGKNTGDFAGVSMIAGTIVILGRPGIRAAAGMKRGTLAVLGEGPLPLLPSFKYDCTYRPQFMGLLLRQLVRLGFTVPESHFSDSFRRFSGDLVALGKGEVLQRLADS